MKNLVILWVKMSSKRISHTHLQFASANTQAKNCKRVCLTNAQSELTLKLRKTKQDAESQLTTMYKNNSGFIAKMKLNKYKKGLCLTEKLVCFNPLLFLY
jgi:hypothetical protein